MIYFNVSHAQLGRTNKQIQKAQDARPQLGSFRNIKNLELNIHEHPVTKHKVMLLLLLSKIQEMCKALKIKHQTHQTEILRKGKGTSSLDALSRLINKETIVPIDHSKDTN